MAFNTVRSHFAFIFCGQSAVAFHCFKHSRAFFFKPNHWGKKTKKNQKNTPNKPTTQRTTTNQTMYRCKTRGLDEFRSGQNFTGDQPRGVCEGCSGDARGPRAVPHPHPPHPIPSPAVAAVPPRRRCPPARRGGRAGAGGAGAALCARSAARPQIRAAAAAGAPLP